MVRNILIALVVANIAFFCWARWVDAPPLAAAASNRDASIPPLLLVPKAQAASSTAPMTSSNSAAAPAAAQSAAPASSNATTPSSTHPAAIAAASMRCRSIGPFEDALMATAAADRLKGHGFTPRDRTADTSNPNVYWVYIGELTSDAQRRALQSLGAAGIKDAAVMTQPEMSDRVSVGVFADQAHAVKRAEQVRALGFKPTLGIRQRNINAHWLDFDLKSSDPDPQPAELLGAQVRPAIGLGPVKLTDCPASSASG